MKRLAALLLVSGTVSMGAQGPAPAPPQGTSPYAAEREQTLGPVLEAVRAGEYSDALKMLEVLLPQYPRDARVLMLAGRTARSSGDDAKALEFYQTALKYEPPKYTQWILHLEIVPLYAAAGDWDNFDRERLKIREAASKDTPFFAKLTGYVIEDIHDGGRAIQVTEYPRLYGRFHTRYRFVLPSSASGPAWKPYIDCESDDIDQLAFAKEHPESSSKGDRSFSLDGYLAPNTHSTIGLFGNGEPTYETVRALVVNNAAPMSTTVRN